MKSARAAGLVLAGGRATRFAGGRKEEALLDGRALIEHVIDRAAPQVTILAISRGSHQGAMREGFPVVRDETPDKGPLAGVAAGLAWAASLSPRAEFLATFACDAPLIPRDLVDRLIEAARRAGAPAAIARSDGVLHPTSAIWSPSLCALANARLSGGALSLIGFAEAAGALIVDVEASAEASFANINSREDLERLRAASRPPASG